jgi:hypothetical protein
LQGFNRLSRYCCRIVRRLDLRTVVTRAPELKRAVVQAFKMRCPKGSYFIRDALKDLDSNLLSNAPQKK